MMGIYNLCGTKGCCPVVELGQKYVRIGEKGNLCTLKKAEWNALVGKIKSGEIR